MAEHNELGKRGEREAVHYIKQKGYKILECNWVCEKHEIDIIALDGNEIVFIEVKTRKTSKWGTPEDAISSLKMRRMVEAADLYINKYDINESVRFDVIAIILNDKDCIIEHFDDAFIPPLN